MQRLEHQFGSSGTHSPGPPHSQQRHEAEAQSPAMSSQVLDSGATATPDNSLAEGAAGLLAMHSTADKPDLAQVTSRLLDLRSSPT